MSGAIILKGLGPFFCSKNPISNLQCLTHVLQYAPCIESLLIYQTNGPNVGRCTHISYTYTYTPYGPCMKYLPMFGSFYSVVFLGFMDSYSMHGASGYYDVLC